MKVRDAMAKTVTAAQPESTVREVAQIMKKEDSGFVPVVAGDRLVGVVTDRDIVIRCLAENHRNPLEEAIDHIMSTNVRTIEPERDISDAADMMNREEIRRIAVIEDGRLVGILSHGNLVQAMEGEGPAKDATKGVTRGA